MRIAAILISILLTPLTAIAAPAASHVDPNQYGDSDHDGLPDPLEPLYGTDLSNPDSDGDGFLDGDEVSHGYDPSIPGAVRMPKRIDVDLSEQRLRYYYGQYGLQGDILISSGRAGMRTPTGTYRIFRKLPVARYTGWSFGRYYDHPNTRWNMEFLPRYFIHGTYWHNNFGTPWSKGCVNVSYRDMEKLYAFTDIDTTVTIHE